VNDVKQLIEDIGGISEFMQNISEQMFVLYSEHWNTYSKQERIATYTKYGPLELMPISDENYYAFKYVNCHKDNPSSNLLSVVGMGMLASVSTGYPLLLSEMTLLTAIRTAVTSALVAKYLMPAKSTSMALIGNGAQCEFQAIAFRKICNISRIYLYDIDENASKKVKNNLTDWNFQIEICSSVEYAVKNADIITTCTNVDSHACLLPDKFIKKNVHINAIGGDRPGKTELDVETLKRASIYVEYEPQTRIEGEIQQTPECNVTEINNLFLNKNFERGQGVTIYDSVGFALEDLCILMYVYSIIKSKNETHLIPTTQDPKNLFSVLQR
jgi:ornithine cyclodeaminase